MIESITGINVCLYVRLETMYGMEMTYDIYPPWKQYLTYIAVIVPPIFIVYIDSE